MAQLFVVAALVGVATVFFDVSDHSYLPFLVGREGLVSANARLGGLNAVGAVAGPSVGGYLVAWLTAPAALLVESASYLWSAAFIGAIRRREPVPEPAAGSPMLGQIREGLAHVFRHPVLSRLAIAGAMGNLFQQLIIVMLPVLLVRELGLSPVLLGAFFAMGGVGGFLGASTASRIGRLVGHGRALWLVSLVPAPASLVVPLVGTGPWLWVAAAGWLLSIAKVGVDNVLGVSFRQSCTPDALLGRMNATFRFLLTGSVAVGAGIAALLGQYVAVRASLWVGGAGLALVWIPIFFSPLRHTSGEDRSPSTLR